MTREEQNRLFAIYRNRVEKSVLCLLEYKSRYTLVSCNRYEAARAEEEDAKDALLALLIEREEPAR